MASHAGESSLSAVPLPGTSPSEPPFNDQEFFVPIATQISNKLIPYQVDYSDASALRFKLAGVDTVISTISGNAQIALIDAAAGAHVRRFVPSEFCGPPSLRPPNDFLDHGRRAAILRLHQLESSGMRFTVFSCGIFYERFAPGGMASSQIGLQSAVGQEGDYLLDFRSCRAQMPYQSTSTQPASICMTSARDVARFIVEALDLPSWPREFRLRGERMNVREIIAIAEQVRGKLISFLSSAIHRCRFPCLTEVQVVPLRSPDTLKVHYKML